MMRQHVVGGRYGIDSVLGGRYEIRSLLGQGGMAEVYSALDRVLGRLVAVKVLRETLAEDRRAVARFRREARAVAALSHPNIISIHDVGSDGAIPFMVMELVSGEALSQVIWREAPLPIDRAAGVGEAVANALAFAHDAGIVHRDVKPGNVMITTSGHVKVLDFGIARALAWTPVTEGGAVQGTAEYVSPEQASGLSLDGRSDIYSLGVVLYEMLTGLPPFRGDTAVAIAYQHLEEQPTPLRRLRPGVPPALEAVALRCLAKERWSRYQNATDLASDLRRYRGGPPAEGRSTDSRGPAARTDTRELVAEPVPSRTARAHSRRGHRVRTVALAVAFAVATLGGGGYLLIRGGLPAKAKTARPAVLFAPTGLRAQAECDGFLKGRLSLSWTASRSTSADGYVVSRATSPGGPFEKIALLPGRAARAFVDRHLNTATTYYYEVRATSGSRISPSVAAAQSKTPSICLL
jgi:tRNA A-37 threonylcarbamoyl transferase component Bud32